MKIHLSNNAVDLGNVAGLRAAELIKKAIELKGFASVILATGTSQFEVIQQLLRDPAIAWDRVQMFHLDEYIGLPITHKASFRRYLIERFINLVPNLKSSHLIDGELDPETECNRLGALIRQNPIDLAFVGIGENGHLAFNDPPADFDTESPYIVVNLDEGCRAQQFGEGWFDTMEDVPKKAISMSIKQIMKSKHIVCTVPDERKSQAVADCLTGEVSNLFPASILQNHPNVDIYLDLDAASRLPENFLKDAR
jgi:glucosamine-6-phosphate deaminase